MNTEPDLKYVSRGGLKLQHAISNFDIRISDLIVLDVGSSTGGFVDCLLQNGAARVYSVDTSYGELAWKLRQDPRVVVMERTNILHLDSLPVIPAPTPVIPAQAGIQKNNGPWIPDRARLAGATAKRVGDDTQKTETTELVDLITIDASWTKLELILPVVSKFLKPDGQIIALLKPHYQADKKLLVKGILPSEHLETVKQKVFLEIRNSNFEIIGEIPSPILGGGGNQEFLLLIKLI